MPVTGDCTRGIIGINAECYASSIPSIPCGTWRNKSLILRHCTRLCSRGVIVKNWYQWSKYTTTIHCICPADFEVTIIIQRVNTIMNLSYYCNLSFKNIVGNTWNEPFCQNNLCRARGTISRRCSGSLLASWLTISSELSSAQWMSSRKITVGAWSETALKYSARYINDLSRICWGSSSMFFKCRLWLKSNPNSCPVMSVR